MFPKGNIQENRTEPIAGRPIGIIMESIVERSNGWDGALCGTSYSYTTVLRNVVEVKHTLKLMF